MPPGSSRTRAAPRPSARAWAPRRDRTSSRAPPGSPATSAPTARTTRESPAARAVRAVTPRCPPRRTATSTCRLRHPCTSSWCAPRTRTPGSGPSTSRRRSASPASSPSSPTRTPPRRGSPPPRHHNPDDDPYDTLVLDRTVRFHGQRVAAVVAETVGGGRGRLRARRSRLRGASRRHQPGRRDGARRAAAAPGPAADLHCARGMLCSRATGERVRRGAPRVRRPRRRVRGGRRGVRGDLPDAAGAARRA